MFLGTAAVETKDKQGNAARRDGYPNLVPPEICVPIDHCSVTLFSGAYCFSNRRESFFLSRNIMQFTEHKSTLSCPRDSCHWSVLWATQSRTHTQAPFPYDTYRILPSSVPLKVLLYMTISVFAFASTHDISVNLDTLIYWSLCVTYFLSLMSKCSPLLHFGGISLGVTNEVCIQKL